MMLSFKRHREHNAGIREHTKVRLLSLFDEGSFRSLHAGIRTSDPLGFPEYKKQVREARRMTGISDGVVAGRGTIDGIAVCAAMLDRNFMMGSMGTVVGETLTRLIETAEKEQLPLILFSASGGARMQEGMFSLMQMAKTSAAIERFRKAGGLYISVLMHPTTGGVSASFAMLGDIILAEPGALIGFAGPRVIEQTIGERLPEGFQRSEFQMEHGFVDCVVERGKMREVLGQILRIHSGDGRRRIYSEQETAGGERSMDRMRSERMRKGGAYEA